jgi:hypothetical protein
VKPSIGRIVLYRQPFHRQAFAAIVTELYGNDRVGLCAFRNADTSFHVNIPYDEKLAEGTWCWPPRGDE